MNKPIDTLDEIVNTIIDAGIALGSKSEFQDTDNFEKKYYHNISKAKAQINQYILSLIGEDAEVPRPLDEESRARFYRVSGQNFLRHQLRSKLKEDK